MFHAPAAERQGLRGRKKALRRENIISAARSLFARKGIDATTMADIADAVEISPPTVFNYFGSKDGILIALIEEGTRQAREEDRALSLPNDADLLTLVVLLFSRITSRTLEIADKKVWRYAESAVIRHPDTDLARNYRAVGEQLVDTVSEFFAPFDLVTRAGNACPPDYIGQLFNDVWNPIFIEFITDESATLADHTESLRARFSPLIALLFDDACAAAPKRKTL